jgi:hypothetical protein
MKRLATLAALTLVVLAGQARAAQPVLIDELRAKTDISAEDHATLRQYINQLLDVMLNTTNPDRTAAVKNREELISEGRASGNRTPAYLQAYGEEAIAALKAVEPKALDVEPRLNIMIAVAELRRIEGVPILKAELLRPRCAATAYWAAKGLDLVADTVNEKGQTTVEQEMAEAAEKAFENDSHLMQAQALLEMLGKFDHDKAHDVLAAVAIKFVQRHQASDPLAAQVMDQLVTYLERAYNREVRPESKTQLLMAYATMCTAIMPPVAASNLMSDLNVSIEKIITPRATVGFSANEDQQAQKLALLEWVERFIREKRITKRPALPKAVEDAAKQMQEGGDVVAPPVVEPVVPVPPAPEPIPAPGVFPPPPLP